ncbi:MAG: PaaI family thioesterase [Dorea sp.]|nr:PaaI family thioesterase [Dorea sp.]
MDLEVYRKKVNQSRAFPVNTGARITVLSPDYAEVVLPIKEEHLNVSGIVQGGVTYAIADFATGMASKTRGTKTVTIESKINYFRPGSLESGSIKAVASARNAGRTIGVYYCDVFDEQEKLLASAVFTYFFLQEEL